MQFTGLPGWPKFVVRWAYLLKAVQEITKAHSVDGNSGKSYIGSRPLVQSRSIARSGPLATSTNQASMWIRCNHNNGVSCWYHTRGQALELFILWPNSRVCRSRLNLFNATKFCACSLNNSICISTRTVTWTKLYWLGSRTGESLHCSFEARLWPWDGDFPEWTNPRLMVTRCHVTFGGKSPRITERSLGQVTPAAPMVMASTLCTEHLSTPIGYETLALKYGDVYNRCNALFCERNLWAHDHLNSIDQSVHSSANSPCPFGREIWSALASTSAWTDGVWPILFFLEALRV